MYSVVLRWRFYYLYMPVSILRKMCMPCWKPKIWKQQDVCFGLNSEDIPDIPF